MKWAKYRLLMWIDDKVHMAGGPPSFIRAWWTIHVCCIDGPEYAWYFFQDQVIKELVLEVERTQFQS